MLQNVSKLVIQRGEEMGRSTSQRKPESPSGLDRCKSVYLQGTSNRK